MIEPVLIKPEALYDGRRVAPGALGLTPSTLAAARRAGTLRFTRTGKRISLQRRVDSGLAGIRRDKARGRPPGRPPGRG